MAFFSSFSGANSFQLIIVRNRVAAENRWDGESGAENTGEGGGLGRQAELAMRCFLEQLTLEPILEVN